MRRIMMDCKHSKFRIMDNPDLYSTPIMFWQRNFAESDCHEEALERTYHPSLHHLARNIDDWSLCPPRMTEDCGSSAQQYCDSIADLLKHEQILYGKRSTSNY
jgi:hypothetical protein